MKNYKELVIWQRGIEIVKKTYELVKRFPSEEKFGITRVAVSIPANIAEGSSRHSGKDNARFVQHSLGSAFEVQTYLIIAREMNWINKEETEELEDLVEREIMMLHKFINTLNNQQ
jgi:four helix bundle protein